MRDYVKPFIEDEDIEIEDICSVSSGGAGQDNVGDIWDELDPE